MIPGWEFVHLKPLLCRRYHGVRVLACSITTTYVHGCVQLFDKSENTTRV